MIGEILSTLPAYQNKTQLEVQHQVTADIMRLIERRHEDWKKEYDKISERFWNGNVEDTAKGLFNFLKHNVKYKIEPGSLQSVKHPSAILKQKVGDCKHMSSFIVGVADSLNRKGYPIEGSFVYANGENNSNNFHHVFALITDTETGKEYWVDPIDDKRFNQRDRYVKLKTVPMALVTISGELGKKDKNKKVTKAEKKAGKQANKEARKANAAARKQERQELKKLPKAERKQVKKEKRQAKREVNKTIRKSASGVQKTSHVLMKVPNAISRGALLTLIKLNAFRLASKIGRKFHADPEWKKELQLQWHAGGGTWQALVQAVNQGINVWNAKHQDKVAAIGNGAGSGYVDLNLMYPWQQPLCNCESVEDVQELADMGADPYTWASIAAVVAAAMPLIIRLTTLLKKADVNTDELNEEGMDASEEVLDTYNDHQEYPDEYDEDDTPVKNAPQYGIRAYNRPGDGTATIEYTKSNIDENGNLNYTGSNLDFEMVFAKTKDWIVDNKSTLLWIGGGVVAIKFLPDIIRSLKPSKRRR